MPPSSPSRALLSSLMTAQQKRCLLLFSLVDFLLHVTMHFLLSDTYHGACNRDSRSLYILPRPPPRFPRSSILPYILSLPAHLGKLTQQLPTQIMPPMTPRARTLSTHLLAHGLKHGTDMLSSISYLWLNTCTWVLENSSLYRTPQ